MKPVSPVVPNGDLKETTFKGEGCEDLPAWVDPIDGTVLIRWELTEEELAQIVETRSVFTWIRGRGRVFPMSVETATPETMPAEEAAAVIEKMRVEYAKSLLEKVLTYMGERLAELSHGAFDAAEQRCPVTMDMIAVHFGYSNCLAAVLNAAVVGGYNENLIDIDSPIRRREAVARYLETQTDETIKTAINVSLQFIEYCEATAIAEESGQVH